VSFRLRWERNPRLIDCTPAGVPDSLRSEKNRDQCRLNFAQLSDSLASYPSGTVIAAL